MISTLINELITAKIDTVGAQMISLKLKEDNAEYLWQANPKYWGRHAPILFPIVGKLKNDQYQVEGETFDLTQHGFARDNEFELIIEKEDEIVYRLASNQNTLEKYPYQFELDIAYQLEKNRVKVKYSVKNKDEKKMYFSIGAHPAFNWPLEKGKQKDDYYLEFETKENVDSYFLEEGLLTDNKEMFLSSSKTKDLVGELFNNDALIFKDLQSEKISLKSKKSKRRVTVEFEGFPYLGIWSKSEEAPFICIEPWYGIADFKETTGELKKKEGIISLIPQAEFSCVYSIEIE
ncbi:aldose 1-epimerase family protein [Halanaerocella petrolearia]